MLVAVINPSCGLVLSLILASLLHFQHLAAAARERMATNRRVTSVAALTAASATESTSAPNATVASSSDGFQVQEKPLVASLNARTLEGVHENEDSDDSQPLIVQSFHYMTD